MLKPINIILSQCGKERNIMDYLNLLTTPAKKLEEAFDLIEGKFFYQMSSRRGTGGKSIFAARDRFREFKEDGRLKKLSKDHGYMTIYGCGGGRRYHVMGDGTIVFDEYYSSDKEYGARARMKGFKVKLKNNTYAKFEIVSGIVTTKNGREWELFAIDYSGDSMLFVCEVSDITIIEERFVIDFNIGTDFETLLKENNKEKCKFCNSICSKKKMAYDAADDPSCPDCAKKKWGSKSLTA